MTQIQSLKTMISATVITSMTALTLASRYHLSQSAAVIIRSYAPHVPGK